MKRLKKHKIDKNILLKNKKKRQKAAAKRIIAQKPAARSRQIQKPAAKSTIVQKPAAKSAPVPKPVHSKNMLTFLKGIFAKKKPEDKKQDEKNKKIIEKKKEEDLSKKVWKVRPLINKYLLGPKIATVVFVVFITLVIILHKDGRFSIAEPAYAFSLAFVFIVFTAYSIIGFYRAMRAKNKGAGFMIDGYKPCSVCKPCMDSEKLFAVPGTFINFIGSRTSNKFHSLACRLAKRISKKNAITFKVKAKDVRIKKPHVSSNRIAIILFVLAVAAIVVLQKKGIFDITEPVSITALSMVFTLFIVYILKGAIMAVKSAKKSSDTIKKEAIKKLQKPSIAKAGKYETDIDRLLRLINDAGRISAGDAAGIFGIKKENVEEWGRILEIHGLIEIEYPAMGEVQLCKKSLKPTE